MEYFQYVSNENSSYGMSLQSLTIDFLLVADEGPFVWLSTAPTKIRSRVMTFREQTANK